MDIAFVESNTTGSGYEVIRAASSRGLRVAFITADLGYYTRPGALEFPRECVAEVIRCDTDDSDAIAKAAAGLPGQPLGLVALGEWHLLPAAEASAKLGLRGAGPDAVRAGRDKYLSRTLCEKAGIPVPAYYRMTSPEPPPGLRLPCVVKPVDDAMSHGVRLCRTLSEVREHAAEVLADTHNIRGQRKIAMALAEDFLNGPEISAEAFVYEGRTTVVALTKKLLTEPPVFVELGHVVPAGLDEALARQCESMVADVVTAIGYEFGAVHAELRLTSEGPRLVEINCRLAGDQITSLVLLATGIDMHGMLIDSYRGLAPSAAPARRRGAAIVFLPSSPGVVRDVSGLERARTMDGVVDARAYAAAGATLRRKGSNSDRLGHVVATGTDGLSALANARAAAAAIRIDLTTAGQPR